jgi:hypothetical protein
LISNLCKDIHGFFEARFGSSFYTVGSFVLQATIFVAWVGFKKSWFTPAIFQKIEAFVISSITIFSAKTRGIYCFAPFYSLAEKLKYVSQKRSSRLSF